MTERPWFKDPPGGSSDSSQADEEDQMWSDHERAEDLADVTGRMDQWGSLHVDPYEAPPTDET